MLVGQNEAMFAVQVAQVGRGRVVDINVETYRCTAHRSTQYSVVHAIDVKRFYVFLKFWSRFLRFLTFFYFPNVFLF